MTTAPSLVFLLDTPNVWHGRALAGTPARVFGLAQHSHQAGADVTLVLCDRGADYGQATDWRFPTLLLNPADFYSSERLAQWLEPISVDFLLMCEAEALTAVGRQIAQRLGARMVYDVHDDELALAASLGEPPEIVERYGAIQRAALLSADHVIVSTTHEMEMATEFVAPGRIALLPNGADLSQRTCWGSTSDSTTLVFVGNLYYEPNARALDVIRTMILPHLRADGIDAHVRVIGRGPLDKTQPSEGIEFTGRVDSIDRALRDATLALAPLTAGSGAKMKVLDYMAAGLPVLGTSEAVSGLPLGHPGVVVVDDLSRWPSVLAGMLRDPITLQELGHQGRDCLERELSWRQIGADLVRHGQAWLSSPPVDRDHTTVTSEPNVPRWFEDHAGYNALGDPQMTAPGQPVWLHQTRLEGVTATQGENE